MIQIAALDQLSSGATQAFLLTTINAIPEPSPVVLLMIGAAVIVLNVAFGSRVRNRSNES